MMSGSESYLARRERLRDYFDRGALRAWEQLTGNGPVSRIRRSVRAGREEMRGTLLGWLPEDLSGTRLLDAGCGTGALAVEAARRGAEVVGVDLSPSLIALARERLPADVAPRVELRAGDMLGTDGERFDVVVAMDSLIHYRAEDMVAALGTLATRLAGRDSRLLFTFAPGTPALLALHRLGKLFPRGDRSPAIEPVAESALRERLAATPETAALELGRVRHVASGFYKSRAVELVLP